MGGQGQFSSQLQITPRSCLLRCRIPSDEITTGLSPATRVDALVSHYRVAATSLAAKAPPNTPVTAPTNQKPIDMTRRTTGACPWYLYHHNKGYDSHPYNPSSS